MKIKISGTEYDAAQLGKLSLFDIIELKRQTGLSVDELKESFADVDKDNPETAMRSEETLIGFGAGERLTFEEACSFPLDELEFIAEPDDGLDDAVDPPMPGPDSGLGANPALSNG